MTTYDQPAPCHQTPSLHAHFAIDENFAADHRLADVIEAIAAAFDANPGGIAHAQAKHLAEVEPVAGCLQLDPLDLAGGFPGQHMWHERREIDPLIGATAERQSQPLHGSRSRKW
jgi:hypothetical protein